MLHMSESDWRFSWKVYTCVYMYMYILCTITASVGLYNEQQQVREAEVVPPLALSLTPSQETMARYFSDQLAAIGVQLQWRDGQPMARTLPAVLMEREAGERQRGRPAVAVSLLQVSSPATVPPHVVTDMRYLSL